MTIIDPRGPIVDALITSLTGLGLQVFDGETPPDVDTSRPWIVVEIPAGGSHTPAWCPGRTWTLRVQLRAAAVDSDTRGGTGWTSARHAVQWATAQTTGHLLDPDTHISTAQARIGYRELLGDSGVDREGTTANQVTDWAFTIQTIQTI